MPVASTLDQLSSLTGITVSKNQDGTVSVLTADSKPLVIGRSTLQPQCGSLRSAGTRFFIGRWATRRLISGQFGALLDFRNGTLQDLLGATVQRVLDDLAKGFASRVNGLFSPVSPPPELPEFSVTYDNVNDSNVARTLALDPTVTTDTIGTFTTGTPRRNPMVWR